MGMTRDASILSYELFQGDRDSDVTIFKNRMLTTRKPHDCVNCRQPIPPKSFVRAQTERDNQDKVVMTFYVCELCCDAILKFQHGDYEALEARAA